MTCVEFYKLMDNEDLLSDKTLSELRDIISDFPYFQAARMLYLQNLAKLKDLRLQTELKKMAVYLPDRVQLYVLIENSQLDKFEINTNPGVQKNEFQLVESFLDSNDIPVNKDHDQTMSFDHVAASDYISWLASDDKQPKDSAQQLQHQELIDSFLDKAASKEGVRLNVKPVLEGDDLNDGPLNNQDLEIEKNNLDASYFTETLAHVYIKQKRFDKALEIIRNLSLKYPEKNIYFADQIRFLEKLIVYTKS